MHDGLAAQPARFSYGLNLARGLAAIGVLGYHSLLAFRVGGVDDPHILRLSGAPQSVIIHNLLLIPFNGQAFVTLFFVLSGAVLGMSLERNPIRSPLDLARYYAKRLFRLYPLLIAATLLAAILCFLIPQPSVPNGTTWLVNQRPDASAGIFREIILNMAGAKSSLNSASWSIKVEIIGSLLFPAIFWFAGSLRRAIMAGVVLLALMAIPHDPRSFAYMSDFTISFLAGAVTVGVGRPMVDRLALADRGVRPAFLAFGLLVLLISRRMLDPASFIPSGVVVLETLGAMAIVAVLLTWNIHDRSLAARAHPLGTMSFSIYLLHVPMLVVLAPVAFRLTDGGWAAASALLFGLAALCASVGAYVAYNLVERPGMVAGRWLSAFGLKERRLLNLPVDALRIAPAPTQGQ